MWRWPRSYLSSSVTSRSAIRTLHGPVCPPTPDISRHDLGCAGKYRAVPQPNNGPCRLLQALCRGARADSTADFHTNNARGKLGAATRTEVIKGASGKLIEQ